MSKSSKSALRGKPTKTRYAVGAIVLKEDQILLVHKVKAMDTAGGPTEIAGLWLFPMGGLSNGETCQDGLQRELFEELGITEFSIRSNLPELRFELPEWYQASTGFREQLVNMFLVEVDPCVVIKPDQDELSDARFFGLDQAISSVDHRENKMYLESIKPLINQVEI